VSLDKYGIDPAQPGGPEFASDKDGEGRHWPYGKLVYGTDGAWVRVTPQTPLPVTITAGNPDTGQALGNILTEWSAVSNSPSSRLLAADDYRLSITVQNFGSQNLWLGGSAGVADGKGTRLLPGQGVIIDRAPRAELWAFSAGSCPCGGIVEKLASP
jgi:hypothetical protein